MVDPKVELLSTVVSSDGFPSIRGAAGSQFMHKRRLRNIENDAELSESFAQFRVFAIEEESLIESFASPHHQARSHNLFDLATDRELAADPVGGK